MIEIKNLTKDYIGFSGVWDRLLSSISFGILGGKVRFRALQDINFICKKSEIVGIIGQNGAGKSTLLKILTGVSKPSSGSIEIKGTIRSILELGVGFNPELSGEENVYYNGLVWGFRLEEIQEVTNRVFEFSNLVEFRKTPLKNYSSGMIMRLGFALATATIPEVLIVDEALAVGDAIFQQKSLEKFKEFKAAGTATLIVSHDLTLLAQICDRIILLHKGSLIYDGLPQLAIQEYMKHIADTSWQDKKENAESTEAPIQFHYSLKKNEQINPSLVFVGDLVELEINYVINESIPQLTIGMHIDHSNGIRVYGTNTYQNDILLNDLEPFKEYKIRFQFPINLAPGKYSIGLSMHQGDNHTTNCYYWGEGLHSFEVERVGLAKFTGITYLPIRILQ